MKISQSEFDRQFSEVTKLGDVRRRKQPLAKSVRLAPDRTVEIRLNNGCLIRVPLRHFPEVRRADARRLRNVRILGLGQAIHWPDLDQQYDLSALLLDVL